MLDVFIILSFIVPLDVHAQLPPQVPPGAQAQLQVQQPLVDVSSAVTAAASGARFSPGKCPPRELRMALPLPPS